MKKCTSSSRYDEEKVMDLVSRSYGIAKEHGFHDVELSINHMIGLVVSEVCEAIEADRKGRHCHVSSSDMHSILLRMDYDKHRDLAKEEFENSVKDSVGDELSDVCIRIYDTCGALGIVPEFLVDDEIQKMWDGIFGKEDFCSVMFHLCCSLCDLEDEEDVDMVKEGLESALSFVYSMCSLKDIPLDRHIELKMKYNELRPWKNGKKY